MTITQEKCEAALHYLAETDASYAEAKANLERASILAKRARARVFLTGSGPVEQRKAEAETSHDAGEADDVYIAAVRAFEGLRAKRQRAELTIDVFRTLEASRRKA